MSACRFISLRATAGSMHCQMCRTMIGNTARRQWQVSRSIHLGRSAAHANKVSTITSSIPSPSRPLMQRYASTTPLKSGPTVNIPEFPSHRRPAADALVKHEIRGAVPSFEALKADEEWGEDTELVDVDEAKIFVTDPALTQLVKIASREPSWNPDQPNLALRLSVESGGCHGYQYDMKLVEERPNIDDYVFKVAGPDGQPAVPVVIDLISLGLLKGSTLHFATELIGSAFGIKDNPQAKESGSCGCGISWEAK